MNLLPIAARSFLTRGYTGPLASSLEILLLQPTPFCNINCDYCYLANRNIRDRMSMGTIAASVKMVMDAKLINGTLSIVWHAGEPLVLPTEYYEGAFECVRSVTKGQFEVVHNFQTNGCRIDNVWCEFAKKHHVRMGLSIDGPAFLHDLHRKTRSGKPTHAQCMRGVQKLKEFEIPFHVIGVITADALDHADSIFHFFESLGMTEVGFNIEESEGTHSSSISNTQAWLDRVRRFWQRLYELNKGSGGSLKIREFRNATKAILASRANVPWRTMMRGNDQVTPLRIISVDYKGQISTFSPELLGVKDDRYSNFVFGNVVSTTLAELRAYEPFQKAAIDVMTGVKHCALSCEYFSVCGGGAPSNKYFENQDLASTTTAFCRASIQSPLQVVLDGIEKELAGLRMPDIPDPKPLK
jgi:uncharacterized protein